MDSQNSKILTIVGAILGTLVLVTIGSLLGRHSTPAITVAAPAPVPVVSAPAVPAPDPSAPDMGGPGSPQIDMSVPAPAVGSNADDSFWSYVQPRMSHNAPEADTITFGHSICTGLRGGVTIAQYFTMAATASNPIPENDMSVLIAGSIVNYCPDQEYKVTEFGNGVNA